MIDVANGGDRPARHESLEDDRIIVTPTLVKKSPGPKTWIVGMLAASQRRRRADAALCLGDPARPSGRSAGSDAAAVTRRRAEALSALPERGAQALGHVVGEGPHPRRVAELGSVSTHRSRAREGIDRADAHQRGVGVALEERTRNCTPVPKLNLST